MALSMLLVTSVLAAALLVQPSLAANLAPDELQAKLGNLRNKLATEAQYVKEDLKYIRCGTCVSMAAQAIGVFGEMRGKAEANNTEVNEGDLLDVLESLCDTDSHGLWIRWLDLQETGEELKVINVEKGPGACGTECRTIAKSCQDTLDSIDVLRFGEAVWSGLALEPLSKKLCREMSDACLQPDPPIPADRVPGPPWQEDKLPDDYLEWKAEEDRKAKEAAKKKAGKKAKKAKKQKSEL